MALPAPGELTQLLGAPRRASYTEEDLIQHGSAFDDALPHSRIIPAGNSAEFHPEYESALGLASAAYCIYSFNAPDYDRDPVVFFSWDTVPPDPANVYIAVGNWDADCWDWYQFAGGETFNPGSLDAYLGESGGLLLAILSLGFNEDFSLAWLRLDEEMPPVTASLTATPGQGLAPLAVEFDASLSEPGVGTIVSHQWDWEGDDTYDWDGADTPTAAYTYEVGSYSPTLLLTTDFGEEATVSVNLAAYSPWEHSWGGSEADVIEAVAADQTGIYCAGHTKSFGEGFQDTLLLKYSLDGSFEWARAFGSSRPDLFTAVATDGEGLIYCAGHSKSYEAGNGDVILMAYSQGGNRQWTTFYRRISIIDYARDLDWLDGALYLTGNTENESDSDVLLAKFGTDGSLLWDRQIDTGDDDIGWAVEVENTSGASPKIHYIARRIGVTQTDMFYGKFNDWGNLEESLLWDGAGDSLYAHDIAVIRGAETRIFATGHLRATDGPDLTTVLEVLRLGVPLSLGWKIEGHYADFSNKLLVAGDDLVLIGSQSLGVDDTRGFILHERQDGSLLGARTVSNPEQAMRLLGGAVFPDTGLLVVGDCASAASNVWSPASFDWQATPGNWVGFSVDVSDAAGTMLSEQGAQGDTTASVHDTGGGAEDGLIAALSLPLAD